MAKNINKIKLIWRGKAIFLPEFLRVLGGRGSSGIRQYLRLLSVTTENERLVEHERKAIVQLFIPPIPSRPFSRYLRSYIDSLIFREQNLHLGTILMAVTDKCPYNCWYCSAGNTPSGEPSVQNIEKTLQVLKSWGTSIVGFTGGEPLLRDDIDGIIRRHQDDFTFVVFSSGHGLDTDRAQRLKEHGLFCIAISLDDHRATRHDDARGRRGAFDISLRAIENAKKAGLYTIIQSVISNELLEDGQIWEFFDLVKATGADELLLLEPLGTGNLLHGNGHKFLTPRDLEKLKWFHEASLDHPTLPKITSFADFEDRTRFGCGAGIQHAYIDVNCNLWPCNFVPVSIGNVISESQTVEKRLREYFGQPCSECILKANRKEMQKLSTHGIPVPFSRAERLLRTRVNTSNRGSPPAFYAAFDGNNGQPCK